MREENKNRKRKLKSYYNEMIGERMREKIKLKCKESQKVTESKMERWTNNTNA